MPAECYVVIDSLRATTVLATLFGAGVDDVLVVDDIDVARKRAAEDGRLLLGEVGGVAPEGFDMGNSPTEVAAADVAGRRAVLFTTNGTRALCSMASTNAAVLTGSLANASAVIGATAAFEEVVFVCAGNAAGRRFSLEDFATAAVLVRKLTRVNPAIKTGDAGGVGVDLQAYEDWIAASLPQTTAPSRRWMASSAHARVLASLGLSQDLHFAAQEDTSEAVPQVVEHGGGWALLRDRATLS